MLPKDLFHGTVPYYARYRIPYPTALLDEICNRAGISDSGRLLDLGCGTGEIAIPMSSRFQEVIAVDSDSEMLAAAKHKSDEQGIKNINWIQQHAEQHTASVNSYELLTIGAAYHWMDRDTIAQNARNWLYPGQPLVVLGYTSIWTGRADWHGVVRSVLQKWLGEKRRAGSGHFDDALDPHEMILTKAGYEVEEIQHQIDYAWTLDHFIGNLYSTSFASPAVLRENQSAFEADLRAALLQYDGSGTYQEQIHFYGIIAYPR